MNSVLGTIGLLISLVGSMAGIAAYGIGIYRKNLFQMRRASGFVYLVLFGAILSTFAMQRALLTHDFSIAYVAQNSSIETPLLYQITGMWSSLSGSILLWATVLSFYLALFVFRYRKRVTDSSFAWAGLVGLVIAGYFFALMLHSANPFLTLAHPPIDGAGPNPLLQDYPLVAFHPPMLYLGYVGFTIPFAFAISSLITNRADSAWAKETRFWALLAWTFLTLGIFLGAWWSYQVLGWGGYWAWDPVENAAFLPWLCGTAYLHSSMTSSKGGNLRVWNVSLLVATFSLTILGTFFTRSGVLQSVHSFSGSTLGPDLIVFFALTTIASMVLIGWRSSSLRSGFLTKGGFTRDVSYVINNLLFSAFAAIVLLGTTFPLLAQAVNGSIVSVGPPFFNAFSAPLALALLFFMTVSPYASQRPIKIAKMFEALFVPLLMALIVVFVSVMLGVKDKGLIAAYGFGSFVIFGTVARAYSAIGAILGSKGRKATRILGQLGSNIAHLGVGVVAIALATSTAFGTHSEVKLVPHGTSYLYGHSFYYQGVQTLVTPSRTSLRAVIFIDGQGPYYPSVSQFGTNPQVVGTPSVRAGVVRDIYLTLDSPPTKSSSSILLGVVIEPFVSWLWVGGGLMGLGGLVALYASMRRRGLTKDSTIGSSRKDDLKSTVEKSELSQLSSLDVP